MSFVSELKLKALGVMREKHKVVRQSKASITEESYFATGEENRWYDLKWSIKCSNPINSQVLYLLTVKQRKNCALLN